MAGEGGARHEVEQEGEGEGAFGVEDEAADVRVDAPYFAKFPVETNRFVLKSLVKESLKLRILDLWLSKEAQISQNLSDFVHLWFIKFL